MACKGWHQITPLFTRLSVSQSDTGFAVESTHSTEAAALSVRRAGNDLEVDMHTIRFLFFFVFNFIIVVDVVLKKEKKKKAAQVISEAPQNTHTHTSTSGRTKLHNLTSTGTYALYNLQDYTSFKLCSTLQSLICASSNIVQCTVRPGSFTVAS